VKSKFEINFYLFSKQFDQMMRGRHFLTRVKDVYGIILDSRPACSKDAK
jgi:hypothetical protein